MKPIFFLSFLILICGLTEIRADDWPQWMGEKRDAIWRETGIIDSFPDAGLKPLWQTKIGGGYAGAAVVGNKVYIPDFQGKVDLKNNAVKRGKIEGKERLLCLDAKTGKELWNYSYDCTYTISYPSGPRCTPTVQGGKVYFLGSEGNLSCLDAEKGTLIWSKDFPKDYQAPSPMWGFCGHPLIDGDKLICIVGGKGSVAVAFNKDTGKEIWKALTAKEPGYSAPTMIELGGKKQLIIWDSENLNGLDPETGKKYWSVKLAPKYGMSIMCPRLYQDMLFAAGIEDEALLVKLDPKDNTAKELYRGKKQQAIFPVNMTPFIENGILYGVDQPGQFCAVKLDTSERLWETTLPVVGKADKKMPTGTTFIVKQGDRFFLFGENGDLIIAKLSAKEYQEISRLKVLEATNTAFGRSVVWSHPAFANRCVYVRNDQEIACYNLAK